MSISTWFEKEKKIYESSKKPFLIGLGVGSVLVFILMILILIGLLYTHVLHFL